MVPYETSSESIGGSGGLSALFFGLILGNEKIITSLGQRLNEKTEKISLCVEDSLKRFETEIAFLIRTFFLVFLGVIASVSSVDLLLSRVLLSFVLLGMRSAPCGLQLPTAP